ncbi:MAG: 30S ribosomal protein S8, partial [Bacillota bacterium]|nr:30S ribosomal protein S8 [Bacillota bacterium]
MVMTDPIADMLTRVRNANKALHEVVELPGSAMKKSLAEILKLEGFIRDFEWVDDDKQGVLRMMLKYGA